MRVIKIQDLSKEQIFPIRQ